MAFLHIIRLVVFAIALAFSFIVLGLSANLVNLTLVNFNFYYVFSALALATAIITIVSLIPMLVIDLTRRGAFTSWVLVELIWLAVLWVLWLATGADTAAANLFTGGSCHDFGLFFDSNALETACNSYKAIQAFAFLTWLILLGYSILLLVCALIGSSRGHQSVWKASVRDADFLSHANSTSTPGTNEAPMHQHQYPPKSGTPATMNTGYAPTQA